MSSSTKSSAHGEGTVRFKPHNLVDRVPAPGWYRLAVVEFPIGAVDPFFNANRPDDLAAAERLLAESGDGAPA